MKYIIVGKSGYIAQRFLQEVKGNHLCTSSSPYSKNTVNLDLANPSSFDYSLISPGDITLLLGAVSKPDICRNQPEYASRINVTGTIEFIDRVCSRSGRVVFFSSDTVYGNRETPASEKDEADPFGPYAEMKYEVEQHCKNNDSVRIFRLSYVFSRQDSFTRFLTDCVREGNTADVFTDLKRNVVYIKDVIDSIESLAAGWNKETSQIYNIAGKKCIPRSQLADLIKANGLTGLKLSYSRPDEKFFHSRPRTIALSNMRMESLLGRIATPLACAVKSEFQESNEWK